MVNNAASAQSRRSLTVTSVIYFGAVFLVGLPVAYATYTISVAALAYLRLGWFVSSAWGITVVAAAFIFGIWVAQKVAEEGVDRVL
ncbi:hypothetical protein [Halobiforma nitratireducens]|uniref:hypothetical protein n=1 Tax=Halobiforma nitratireducens TaxID=130048 RepID=UPI0012694CA6|nr:hypothetical protein [Halobiforma nitratireducens]